MSRDLKLYLGDARQASKKADAGYCKRTGIALAQMGGLHER